ncbi:sensor domain-containing diguanylate cyclase [Planococcus shenhongbingii]|uniref:Diguanylate cyclase n=1 Tax=Planococcus shenhongbingii TaxID=3058398 RepID=A0ABT8N7V5_9BACL|nr:diguanylate cyclase [Planococcus sp. N017]MDN7243946.1 diguanylate cyclase [Planococcus sp. N017]
MAAPFTAEQLNLLYGHSEDLVFFLRKTGDTFIYEYINDRCEKNFRRNLVGLTIDEILPPDLAAEIKKQYETAITKKTSHTYRDYNLFSLEKTAIENHLTPIYANGEIYVLAVSKNVSRQKKAEEDYLFYQSLIQNTVDPMLMITSDYTILDINPAYETAFGFSKEDWMGKSFDDLPIAIKKMFKEMKQRLDAYEIGQPVHSAVFTYQKSDGTNHEFSGIYTPIIENGKIRAFQIVMRELTKVAKLKEELKKTVNILESYKVALNYAASVAIWEPDGIIQFANENFKQITGYEIHELIGMDINEIGTSVSSVEQYEKIQQKILSGSIWRGELKSLKKTREGFWVDATLIPLIDVDGQIFQVLGILFDITDRKELEEQLRFMAYHDSLTKLPNRISIVQEFARMKKNVDAAEEWIAVLFIDGDDFKLINDQYGHDTGDEFLYQFGQAIQKSIRKKDRVARIGGDEFLIALTGIDPEQAEFQICQIVERIKNNLQKGWEIQDCHFAPTASMGIALYPRQATDFDQLVIYADNALYEAKRNGKNQVMFYTENPL